MTTLKKLEVSMNLCCNSCIETIGDKISDMPGVSDFYTDKTDNVLTIYERPSGGPDHKQLLKKLKIFDKCAKILKANRNTSEKKTEKTDTNNKEYYMIIPRVMTPWNFAPGNYSMSIWPFFTNSNFVQHRVCCTQCLSYGDVVCSNCGRPSELGTLY